LLSEERVCVGKSVKREKEGKKTAIVKKSLIVYPRRMSEKYNVAHVFVIKNTPYTRRSAIATHERGCRKKLSEPF